MKPNPCVVYLARMSTLYVSPCLASTTPTTMSSKQGRYWGARGGRGGGVVEERIGRDGAERHVSVDRSEATCTTGSYTRRPTSRRPSSLKQLPCVRSSPGPPPEQPASGESCDDLTVSGRALFIRTRLLVVLTQYLLGGANCSIPGHVATTVSWCCVRPGPRTIG